MTIFQILCALPEYLKISPADHSLKDSITQLILLFVYLAIYIYFILILNFNSFKNLFIIFDGQPIHFSNLTSLPRGDQFYRFCKYIGAHIIYMLSIILGLLFMILPGIYIAIRYSQVTNLILDKNMEIFDAFSNSALMTKNIKWKFIFFELSQVMLITGLVLAGIICLGIGVFPAIFIAIGWVTMNNIFLYRKLAAANTPPSPVELKIQ
jgi:hypothetical protein